MDDNSKIRKIIKTTLNEWLNEQHSLNYIKWDDLNITTKNDITENLRNNIKYLQDNYWNAESLRDIINDSINQPKFKVEYKNVNELYNQLLNIGWSISDINLKQLINKIENGIELDPILLNNGKFYDGGHRLTAYKKLGIKQIPTIDFGFLLNFNWEKWDNNELDF